MILFSTFDLLYSVYHAFSLKSLLLFDFTAYNFLIILFLKLGKIRKMTPFSKCRNNCVPGLPRPRVKRRAGKEIQTGKKSPKDKGRASRVLEKEMATHSSILTWRIPWTEEPGRLQSLVSQRVRHDWDFHFALDTLPESSHWVFTSLQGFYYLYFPKEEIEAVR